jgi:hypothetical protein
VGLIVFYGCGLVRSLVSGRISALLVSARDLLNGLAQYSYRARAAAPSVARSNGRRRFSCRLRRLLGASDPSNAEAKAPVPAPPSLFVVLPRRSRDLASFVERPEAAPCRRTTPLSSSPQVRGRVLRAARDSLIHCSVVSRIRVPESAVCLCMFGEQS